MKTRQSRRIRGMTEEMWQQSTNPLQVAIAPRSWPTSFNHSLNRKCGLVTCAFVIHSPAAFRSPVALEITQAAQQHFAESPPSEQLQQTTRSKLLEKFPRVLVDTRYHLSINQLQAKLAAPDEARLQTFLHAVTHYLGRYGMSQVAAQYLDLVGSDVRAAVGKQMADIVRDILGNPFRPKAVLSEWREANFGAVQRIAEHIVTTRNYDDVTILADALEDAGCSDQELLIFCRTGKHYPGCWVVDAVLGRH